MRVSILHPLPGYDLPDPDTPVNTTGASRGMSMSHSSGCAPAPPARARTHARRPPSTVRRPSVLPCLHLPRPREVFWCWRGGGTGRSRCRSMPAS
jgi:hypothetical protein